MWVIEVLVEAQESGQRFAQIVRDMATFANPDPARNVVRLSITVNSDVGKGSTFTVELPVVRASAHPG
jgi:hypothetical protein